MHFATKLINFVKKGRKHMHYYVLINVTVNKIW